MKKNGMTLIELLVVISIISFFSSLLLVGFRDAREKARIAGLKVFSASIKHLLYNEITADFKFDDATNIVFDSSHINQGINDGGGTLVRSDIEGTAFLGVGDLSKIIQLVPDPLVGNRLKLGEGSGAITIEVWIYPTISSSWGLLTNENYYGINYEGATKTLQFWIVGESGLPYLTFKPVVNISLNQWHHIAVVYDSNKNYMRMYFDAKEVGFVNTPGWFGPVYDGQFYNFYIGSDPFGSGSGNEFVGKIDEVRIYTSSF